MFAIIGCILFAFVLVMEILVACGLPLGEFTMGGRYKVLPKNLRIMAWASLPIQLFAIWILLQAGGLIPMILSAKAVKYIGIGFAVYLSINTVMNLLSASKKEKYVMGLASTCTAICFWVVSLT